MKTTSVLVLLTLTTGCAGLSNREAYVTLQKETPTTCVYGRHGTQTDDHNDFAVSKSELGLKSDEQCAKWVTKVCENVQTKSGYADGPDGRTVMLTTYQCERQTINGRVVRPLKPKTD